jgi:hypothetical protein
MAIRTLAGAGEQGDCAEIVGDEAVKAPLVAEDFGEQAMIDGVGSSVDGVVGRHQRLRMGLRDNHLPVRQPVLHEIAIVDFRVAVLTSVLDVVDGVVLDGGGELEVVGVVALQTLDVGDAHLSGEGWIFAEDLLDAAPARVAGEVDDGRTVDETVARAGSLGSAVIEGAAFVGHGIGDAVNQGGIPGGSHGDGRWEKGGGLLGPDAVQGLIPSSP